jgi:ATPase subunit of ABC transporter with duplicated ATPase domains
MASYQYVYHMENVSKTYPGGKTCFENIHLNFLPGVKIGVVGVNGAGKSTLLKIMAGMDKDFKGEAWAAKGAKVGYLAQEPQLDPKLTAKENVMLGVAAQQAILDRYNELAMNYSDETADEMAQLQDQIDAQNLWELEATVGVAMDALRCPPDDADVTTLSGGERRRVALCKLLLEKPDMLLLDEPTNHLDAESIAWLQKHLIDYKGTILIVTHDRYFLDDITGWILELDRGRGIPYEGNYSAWLDQKAKRMAQEAREDKTKQKALEKELEWIRSGAKARQAKGKARLNRYNEMAGQTVTERATTAQIIIPNGERLGNKVIEVEGLKKHMGDKLLIEDLTFTVPPGEAHWHLLQRARAVEASAWVVCAAQTGKHEDGRSTYGHSLVVDPWGDVVLDMGGEAENHRLGDGFIRMHGGPALFSEALYILPHLVEAFFARFSHPVPRVTTAR